MDSRKFKKVNNDTPKLKHKRKKRKVNYMYIIKVLLVFIVIVCLFVSVSQFISNSRIPENAELVYPSQFNFTPYGYESNNMLYGNCIASDSNNNQDYYYFNLEQMSALAYHSKNSFNYTEGIYINYTVNSNNYKIVDKIFDHNKNEIKKPDNFDENKFKENARFIGRDSPYCSDDFGFSPKEYADSILAN